MTSDASLPETLTPNLLAWYDRHARALPWRVSPADGARGIRPDPYRVWLSEIMLQQTTIPHGTRYFLDFTARWPIVEDLAAASTDEVMARWAGLGYYARARNLHKCARAVAEMGRFPDTYEGLIALPGIGPYTAGAIAAIAFNRPVAAIDGNVDRVVSRLLALETPVRDVKPLIRSVVTARIPPDRPGDFAQAMMDLGATVCTPTKPACLACPVSAGCKARLHHRPETFPIKPPKKAKPQRYGAVFLLISNGHLTLERRPEKGLLGGMLGLPGTDWTETPSTSPSAEAARYAPGDWTRIGTITHVVTHFSLELSVWTAESDKPPKGPSHPMADIGNSGLPSVFMKAARLAT